MHKISQHDLELFVRRNLLRAIKLGYSPEEIIDTIRALTARGFVVNPEQAADDASPQVQSHASHAGWTSSADLTLAVTECSLEQSEDLARDLELALQINAVPTVLQVLREDAAKLIRFLGPRTLYVTTPFHQVEVIEILAQHRLEPFILDLSLSREFLKTLQRQKKYAVVGVLCRDLEALAAASGLVHAYLGRGDATQVIEALVEDQEALQRLIRDAEIVIHAPNCRVEAQTLLPWGIEKVETTFDIDPESLGLLRRLVETQRVSV